MIKWITSNGEKTALTDMDTKHLFYTLRLLYNSFMPRDLSIGTYKQSYFTPSLYTSEYLLQLVPKMYGELISRTDLSYFYQQQLANMQIPHMLDAISSQEKVEVLMHLERDGHYEPEEITRTWAGEEGEDYEQPI